MEIRLHLTLYSGKRLQSKVRIEVDGSAEGVQGSFTVGVRGDVEIGCEVDQLIGLQ